MDRIRAVSLAISLSLLLSGCATIINGTSQKIMVTSEPAGATVQADGGRDYTTPVKLRLERRRDHELVFRKEGYKTAKVALTHVLSESVCGNLFLGGPLGWIFDIFAGTQYKLIPNPAHVKLESETG